jgi:nicotinate-nucleotide pyrophosphorylase
MDESKHLIKNLVENASLHHIKILSTRDTLPHVRILFKLCAGGLREDRKDETRREISACAAKAL